MAYIESFLVERTGNGNHTGVLGQTPEEESNRKGVFKFRNRAVGVTG